MSCSGVSAGAGCVIGLMSAPVFSFPKMAADKNGKFGVAATLNDLDMKYDVMRTKSQTGNMQVEKK